VRPSQLTGAVLGERYKIHGYLSRGSASRVYLAEDLDTGGAVVIRMLSPEAAKDVELMSRIVATTRRLEPISHPNLVDLLGVGETSTGLPYLVMEALSGERLDDVLRRDGRLPADLALVFARQAAAGLVALHKAGVVHGDLTPASFMVQGAPEEPYGVKLLDYGLSQLWQEPRPDQADGAREAVAYLSPEQILLEPIDAHTDVFGLGIVLFQMLIGHLPFDASVGHLVRHQLFSPIPQATWLEAGLDPRLEAVIVNATRKRRENRYASPEALLQDLDAVVGLRADGVEIRPLERTPDQYEPQTELGQQRLDHLSKKFPSLPPSSDPAAVG
jgi:serine/threonine-protein kinase